MNKILTIQPGQWDSFFKALKHLSFLPKIQIFGTNMNVQIATNAWLSVDFSGVLGGNQNNFAFLNTGHAWKELGLVPNGNTPVEVYESDKTYDVTNGKAYAKLHKYIVFDKKINISDYTNNTVRMGTKSVLGKSDSETLFKLMKNKDPIDLIMIDDELTAIGNHFGSRFPVAKNTVKDILNSAPTSMYRSFSFDKLDGKTVIIDLFQPPGNSMNDAQLNTFLHAQIAIDTAITFNFVERLIPISKSNWRN